MGSYTVYNNETAATSPTEILTKEQVGDLISNLYPLDTPLQQILAKEPVDAPMVENVVDTFSTAEINRVDGVFDESASFVTTSAKPEGWTYADDDPTYEAKIKSQMEIQGRQFSVTDTNRQVSKYAIADRFAHEALKKTTAVVNMFEHSFWWSPGNAIGGADLNSGGDTIDIARQTQGLMHWIGASGLLRSISGAGGAAFSDNHGNNFGSAGSTAAINASSWMYNANGLALDQAMFKDQLMGQWYSITGRQSGAVGFAGAKVKNLFSQFALTANGPVNERTLDAAAKLVVDTVDYYETDFGLVSINLCRYLNLSDSDTIRYNDAAATVTVQWNEALAFIKPEYFSIGVLRPIYMSPLSKDGDFERGLVRGEMGLICRNPSAGAAIVNCIP